MSVYRLGGVCVLLPFVGFTHFACSLPGLAGWLGLGRVCVGSGSGSESFSVFDALFFDYRDNRSYMLEDCQIKR